MYINTTLPRPASVVESALCAKRALALRYSLRDVLVRMYGKSQNLNGASGWEVASLLVMVQWYHEHLLLDEESFGLEK